MDRLRPTKWVKNRKNKGVLLGSECTWCKQHIPSRQSNKSVKEKRK